MPADGTGGAAVARAAVGRRPAAHAPAAPEAEGLEPTAQGRTNAAVTGRTAVTERAIAEHTAGVFAEPGLQVPDGGNRRVPAVLAHPDHGR
ncbi:hypothetical protein HTV45_08370 [Streptomyces sp. CHD11]|uniref:hypothetical protein n=1 Tax=Streptomyces sp. CHD11 TaxID=2741325 RepID=UPI001BFC9F66|nr:hypothetical protein [Streptomyces sp. CHD11]MBT3150901.1 hypothetical protein [Streptomyces sp. CHD11]